jgi:polyhydroxyalkanoate synthase
MTQLPKVKDTFVNSKTAQSILKTRAGKQAAQVFSNAADRFLRGHQLALSGKTL